MIMWERFVPPIFCLHCYSRSGKIYKFKYFATSHPIEVWVKFRLPKNFGFNWATFSLTFQSAFYTRSYYPFSLSFLFFDIFCFKGCLMLELIVITSLAIQVQLIYSAVQKL